MAIRQGGVTVIDDSRNIVNANTVMLNGDFTPYVNEGPNILWSAAGSLVSTFDNPNAYDNFLNDNFGYAVDVDGNYAIVGAYAEEDLYGSISGKAYIYNVVTGSLIRTLDNPNPYSSSNSDEFGKSVAISGNYAIVGAWAEDDAGGGGSGKAYIFNVTTGALVHTLNNQNAYSTSQNDGFGDKVAISGNYAIVGAYLEEDPAGSFSGKAYIYNVITGALLWTLDNPNEYSISTNDQFAYSVAIAGNYAIVGARYEDETLGNVNSGKAYIYNVTTGALVHTLNNQNAYGNSQSDAFGSAVAISGNYAIVGAPGENSISGGSTGNAYVYNVTTGALLWTLNNPYTYTVVGGDYFGNSVGISGNFAIVGAYGKNDGNSFSGTAYIFNVTTGALVYTLNNPNAYSISENDYFGFSVSISDNYAIVGAYLEDDAGGSGSGKAYTFALNTTYRTGKPITTASDFGYVRKNAGGSLVWTLDNPNAYSTGRFDYFGNPSAIHGNYVAISAANEDDIAGASSGVVYVFNISTGQLLYTIRNPNAYQTTPDDYFGYSLDMNSKYLAVGSWGEDGPAGDGGQVNRGIVYLFDITNGQLVSIINNPNFNNLTFNTDRFGSSIRIFNNYLIVAAPEEDQSTDWNQDSGVVYVFELSSLRLLYTVTNPNAYSTPADDLFGTTIDASENHLIVATLYEDSAGGLNSGVVYVYNIKTGAFLFTITNPDTYVVDNNDYFGQSVSIYGDYLAVGASGEDYQFYNSGVVYVYKISTQQLIQTIPNPNSFVGAGNADSFGRIVFFTNNRLFVSAITENDINGNQSGVVYVYNFNSSTGNVGSLIQTLNNPNAYSTSSFDYFGISIDISGNYAVIGTYEDDAGGQDSGKAYIFSVNDTYRLTNVEEVQLANGLKISADNKLLQQSVPGGALVHTLDNPNAYGTSAGDQFGSSVAISGNYAIVGARYEDYIVSGGNSGKAYIYNVTTGALVHTLDNPTSYSTSAGDFFGYSVAISGNYAIVGAYNEDDAGGTGSGKAYIYNVTTGALLWTLNNENAYSTSADDFFGFMVAISGNYAIVGAYNEDDAGGTGSGKAYIYNVTTGALLWTLNNPNDYSTSADDNFGFSVAISGNFAIVGAYAEDEASGTASGKAYIFNVTTGALLWTLNNENAFSTSDSDLFGYSVAISGNYAIVGAYAEDDVTGSESGKAYIFNVTTGALVWTLNNPNAYSISNGDRFGVKVAISDNYAIVGAYWEDSSESNDSGKAYIFNVTTGALLYTLNNPNAYDTPFNEQFGFQLAISDNYAIFGVPAEDDAGGTDSGKAYIFSVHDMTYLDRLVQMVS